MNMFHRAMAMAAVFTASVAIPFTGHAQSMPEELNKKLSEKYSPRIKVTKLETMQSLGSFGIQQANLGPYVFHSRVTTLGGASRLGKPTKLVKKYCEESQSGAFNQVAQILPEYKLSVDPIIINDNGKQHSLTSRELLYLTRTFESPKGEQKRSDGWISDHYFLFKKQSEKGRLGVFQCKEADGNALWSVAIIPDRYLDVETKFSDDMSNYKKTVSILPLDSETIENYRGAVASGEQVKEQISTEKQQAVLDRDMRRNNLRATADVGTETSCGLIIQKRGTLAEVDLKSKYARNSGKGTAWIKIEDLFPDEVKETCYLN